MKKNEELESVRVQIDELDRKLLTLFEQRIYLAKKAGKIKQELGLPVQDANRETEKIASATAFSEENGAMDAAFMSEMIRFCRESQKKKRVIAVINGPNLNMLGKREPAIYGKETLAELEKGLKHAFPYAELLFFQSNVEGELINFLQEADEQANGVLLNAGGFTHTSVAIRDAIAAIAVPVIEVHISNIYAREEFRQHSLLAPVCMACLCGLGFSGYYAAVAALLKK